jgi:hypothetical protein
MFSKYKACGSLGCDAIQLEYGGHALLQNVDNDLRLIGIKKTPPKSHVQHDYK